MGPFLTFEPYASAADQIVDRLLLHKRFVRQVELGRRVDHRPPIESDSNGRLTRRRDRSETSSSVLCGIAQLMLRAFVGLDGSSFNSGGHVNPSRAVAAPSTPMPWCPFCGESNSSASHG